MNKTKNFKRRIAITMVILSGVCLTCLSLVMSVGSNRL